MNRQHTHMGAHAAATMIRETAQAAIRARFHTDRTIAAAPRPTKADREAFHRNIVTPIGVVRVAPETRQIDAVGSACERVRHEIDRLHALHIMRSLSAHYIALGYPQDVADAEAWKEVFEQ